MVNYDPDIPQPGDNLSDSQGEMLNNFTQLNNIFDSDHFTWNNSTVANRGLHRQITFPAVLSADPTPTGAKSVIYSKAISGVSTAFFANSAGASAIWAGGSGPGIVSLTHGGNDTNGLLTLGNGLILQWAKASVATNVPATIVFPTPFPNACFTVLVSCDSPPAPGVRAGVASVAQNSVTASQFIAIQNIGFTASIRYLAIGN